MKINGNEIRPGFIIEHNNQLWVVTKTQHTQPGKGGAYLQAEMKNIRTGSKLNERFRSSESVERARLDEQQFQYLFDQDDELTFMDQETFEQITVHKNLVGDPAVFLEEGMIVTVSSYENEIVSIELPTSVIVQIKEADPVVKGQTASASYKPAILENGVRVMVPPHIDSGTRIVVSTADREYIERAKDL